MKTVIAWILSHLSVELRRAALEVVLKALGLNPSALVGFARDLRALRDGSTGFEEDAADVLDQLTGTNTRDGADAGRKLPDGVQVKGGGA